MWQETQKLNIEFWYNMITLLYRWRLLYASVNKKSLSGGSNMTNVNMNKNKGCS